MSIVASTLVHDGLVLGADSMVQITGADSSGRVAVIQSYEHAQKLYRFSKRIGVASWGIGNIGPRSVGSFISDCSERMVNADNPVEDVARTLFEMFQDVYEKSFEGIDKMQWPDLGILVGGYSPSEPLAEEWEFTLPKSSKPSRVQQHGVFGASWRGITRPFTRLYKGVDPALLQRIEAKKRDLDPLVLSLVFDAMPIQEAIDFVVFILQTTINVAKFELGSSSCGGPLWVALITRDEEFRWIERPRWKVRGLYGSTGNLYEDNRSNQ